MAKAVKGGYPSVLFAPKKSAASKKAAAKKMTPKAKKK